MGGKEILHMQNQVSSMNRSSSRMWTNVIFVLLPIVCALASKAIAPLQMEMQRNYDVSGALWSIAAAYLIYLAGMMLLVLLIHRRRVSKLFMWIGTVVAFAMFLIVQTIYPISIFLRSLYPFFAWCTTHSLPGYEGLVFLMFAYIFVSSIVMYLPSEEVRSNT